MIRGCRQLELIEASPGSLLELGTLRLPCGSAHVVETKKPKVCDQFQRGTDSHMCAAGVSPAELKIQIRDTWLWRRPGRPIKAQKT